MDLVDFLFAMIIVGIITFTLGEIYGRQSEYKALKKYIQQIEKTFKSSSGTTSTHSMLLQELRRLEQERRRKDDWWKHGDPPPFD